MLGLTLREEFRGKRLKGTAIELSNDTNTGATQIAAQSFLEISTRSPSRVTSASTTATKARRSSTPSGPSTAPVR